MLMIYFYPTTSCPWPNVKKHVKINFRELNLEKDQTCGSTTTKKEHFGEKVLITGTHYIKTGCGDFTQ